jgi:hypothetical protein
MPDRSFTPGEAARRAIDGDLRLDGEDPHTTYLEDAVHWVSVYSELLAFKDDLLQSTHAHVARMTEGDAKTDAMTDVVLLETQSGRYRRRLAEWTARARTLAHPGGGQPA